MAMNSTEQLTWDPFFKTRADKRGAVPGIANSSAQRTLHFEVFVGPNRADFKGREPSFPTVDQASRWAYRFSGQAEWRVRSTVTGMVVCRSEPPANSKSTK